MPPGNDPEVVLYYGGHSSVPERVTLEDSFIQQYLDDESFFIDRACSTLPPMQVAFLASALAGEVHDEPQTETSGTSTIGNIEFIAGMEENIRANRSSARGKGTSRYSQPTKEKLDGVHASSISSTTPSSVSDITNTSEQDILTKIYIDKLVSENNELKKRASDRDHAQALYEKDLLLIKNDNASLKKSKTATATANNNVIAAFSTNMVI
jgi:hypothetical protein